MFQPDHAAPGASAPSADEQRKHWRDYVVAQDWGHFTPEEHGVWDILFARQVDHLDGKVVSPFLGGIGVLGLDRPGIPDLDLLNQRLEAATGWRCVSEIGRAHV